MEHACRNCTASDFITSIGGSDDLHRQHEIGDFEDNAAFDEDLKRFDAPSPLLVHLLRTAECYKHVIKLYNLSNLLYYFRCLDPDKNVCVRLPQQQ